jgi:hypothetical protein
VAHRGDGADAIALLEARARLRTEPCGQLDLERAGLGAHLHREAGLAQHLEHPVVLRVHPRDERRDPGHLGELGEVRQQDGRDPVPLPRITAKASSARLAVSGMKLAWATISSSGPAPARSPVPSATI